MRTIAILAAALGLLSLATGWAQQAPANPAAPAEFAITERVLRPRDKVPPLGVNNWGRCGAIEWAANNFVHNSGNEPVTWRNLHRVMNAGPNWFEIDGPGTSWYDLWGNGFLSGADLRIYRLVDAAGNPLPEAGNYLDLTQADRVALVGKARVVPEGAKEFPDGGWIATRYADVHPNAWVRHGNLAAADASAVENGRTYWYVVVAVSADNQESAVSNEVSATPTAGAPTPPRVLVVGDGDKLPALRAGARFEFTPRTFGGRPPLRWEVVDEGGNPLALPEGLALDAATGRISGTPRAAVEDVRFRLRVTDAAGQTGTRWYVLNPRTPTEKGKPEPPQDLTAAAGDGCVTLAWKPSPSANVVAYRVKRSVAPAAQQMGRVYVEAGAPALRKFDYVVLEKRFGNFDMKGVNTRVRGIGNPANAPAWYWNADLSKTAFSLVPHPQPVPAEMADPGETCLQVTARQGEQNISQFTFIGTQMGGESLWYGQLVPGKQYRMEAWLRQKGLANDGAVTFSFGRGYRDLRKEFRVTDQWVKVSYDFTGPERPGQEWHFGPQFAFTGPGTLWMDNCRVVRCDRPEDAAKGYVPDPVVLNELLASQPAVGPKGAHRIWFLSRDAALRSILGWNANAQVRPDWRTAVNGTMEMTLPMGLMFDLQTGANAQSRMRPWLVLQHVLHSEADWQALIEYLAAPYDPAKDTPAAKPWAALRARQRGGNTPWTEEFAEIIIEFGNETWHNGIFDDWLGFRTRNAVHQGGPEYGLFCEYLIGAMKASPYWKSANLDGKIRFSLGANYDGRVDAAGKVRGYGEEAMQTSPSASLLGHANYVGPKWETGDKSSGVFDDHGVQETLLCFLAGPERGQARMAQAREALVKARREYDLVAYEGGPSGYALPGRDTPQVREANEKYGKSLAMAVAALDSWMRSYQYGWTHQCFFSYGQGSYWNSHTTIADGFRPTPGWLAMVLRNRHASGDLMVVEERSVPTFQRGKDTYPLAGAYALRDGNRWSVFVVSRKLDGQHDGADFGDGTTPVTLRLPFTRARQITLHKLAGDPRSNNREKMNVSIQSQPVPASALKAGVFAVNAETGGLAGGMPPGSIYLYVFEGAAQ